MIAIVLSIVMGICFLSGLSIGMAIGSTKTAEIDFINLEKRGKDGN